MQAAALLQELRTGKEYIQTVTDLLSCICPFLTSREKKNKEDIKFWSHDQVKNLRI